MLTFRSHAGHDNITITTCLFDPSTTTKPLLVQTVLLFILQHLIYLFFSLTSTPKVRQENLNVDGVKWRTQMCCHMIWLTTLACYSYTPFGETRLHFRIIKLIYWKGQGNYVVLLIREQQIRKPFVCCSSRAWTNNIFCGLIWRTWGHN